jgi:hypothetical protein
MLSLYSISFSSSALVSYPWVSVLQSRALSSPAQTSDEYGRLEIRAWHMQRCHNGCYTIPLIRCLLHLGGLPVGPRKTLRITALPQRQSEVFSDICRDSSYEVCAALRLDLHLGYHTISSC